MEIDEDLNFSNLSENLAKKILSVLDCGGISAAT